MGWILSNALRSAIADTVTDAIDGGSTAGKIRVYTGSRPAGPDTAISDQTLLLEFTFNDPSFGSASNGVITLDSDPAISDDGITDGTAAWCRVLDSDDVAQMDGSVTATGGGGDLTLSSVTVSTGVTYTITGGTLTMPAGSA